MRQYEVVCQDCQQAQVQSPPSGLEMERAFGARLEATVVYSARRINCATCKPW